MKKTDLEKLKGLKISGSMKQTGIPDRFGKAATQIASKREQREAERAAGLVPFAVKLPSELTARLRAEAESRNTSLNALVEELLRKGLS